MIVTVKTEHFRKATHFLSLLNCPLALAIRDVLPNSRILVGGSNVNIDDKKCLPFKGWSESSDGENIVDLIERAKNGEEVPTFEVEIIGI